MIEIEINGQTLEVENGEKLISICDKQGIEVPRFCYHKDLSIAANCRMCLVVC
jgi:NADH-quinone oxidoreductase subunit G